MRPSWDEYFMEIAYVVKKRSTCLRRQVGAVIVKENQIITTGYNGAPKSLEHCEIDGCIREKMGILSGQRHELCKALHAEQNAIVQAACSGVSIKDAVIYVTAMPCSLCSKMCINAGIKRIVYNDDYPDEFSKTLLDEAKVELIKFN